MQPGGTANGGEVRHRGGRVPRSPGPSRHRGASGTGLARGGGIGAYWTLIPAIARFPRRSTR